MPDLGPKLLMTTGLISSPQIGTTGITVADAAGITRVQMGQIGTFFGQNYGLKVVSADGATVIIDGTSDMFKITASGSTSAVIPAVSGGTLGTATVTTALPGLGTLPTTPAHQSYVASAAGTAAGRSQSPLTQYAPGAGFLAASSGGSPTTQVLAVWTTGYMRTSLTAGIAQIDFVCINAATGTTYYGYYYILQEAAL